MTEMMLTFQGTDLVVPKAVLLRLGLRPGDSVSLKPVPAPTEVQDETLEEILNQLYGIWGPEEEEAFYRHREEMWASWKPRDWL